MNMTPEQMRVAIAEACGWVIEPGYGLVKALGDHDTEMPDYPADLNAMHEAEKVLAGRKREIYARLLTDLCDSDTPLTLPGETDYIGYIEAPAAVVFDHVHATSHQRAEAFCATLNLQPSRPAAGEKSP